MNNTWLPGTKIRALTICRKIMKTNMSYFRNEKYYFSELISQSQEIFCVNNFKTCILKHTNIKTVQYM